VLDNRGTDLVSASGAVSPWNVNELTAYRHWVEGFGLKLDVFALDVGSILLDSLVDLEGAKKQREVQIVTVLSEGSGRMVKPSLRARRFIASLVANVEPTTRRIPAALAMLIRLPSSFSPRPWRCRESATTIANSHSVPSTFLT
jgi:hypothetical protein